MALGWDVAEKNFGNYLRIEKSLSMNSVVAYQNDLGKLKAYIESEKEGKEPCRVTYSDLSDFIAFIAAESDSARTQARMISGDKSLL